MNQSASVQRGLGLRGSFVLVLILGTIGCVVGWMTNLAWITIGVPLAAMALHAVICFRDTARSEFADSMYFLGFLFTLISLAVSLIGFLSRVSTEEIMPALLSSFGTAVLTTIVGLATRIYLTSLQPSADEDLIATEEALTAAAQRFRRAIDDMTVSVTSQASAVNQALTTTVFEVRDTLAGATSETKKSLTESAAALSSEVEAAAVRLREGLASLPEALAASGSEAAIKTFAGLQEQTDKLGSSVESLGSKVNALELPADAITAKLEPALAAIESMLKSRIETLERLATESEALTTQVREACGRSNEVTAGLSQLADALINAAGALGSFGSAARPVSELATKLGELEGQATRLAKLAADVNASSLEDVTEFKKLTSELRDMRSSLASDVAEASNSLRLLHKQIVSAATYVAESLRGESRP